MTDGREASAIAPNPVLDETPAAHVEAASLDTRFPMTDSRGLMSAIVTVPPLSIGDASTERPLEEPQEHEEDRGLSDRGGASLVIGGVGTGGSVLGLIELGELDAGPPGWALFALTLALSGSIFSTGWGAVHLTASYVGHATEEQDREANIASQKVASLANPYSLGLGTLVIVSGAVQHQPVKEETFWQAAELGEYVELTHSLFEFNEELLARHVELEKLREPTYGMGSFALKKWLGTPEDSQDQPGAHLQSTPMFQIQIPIKPTTPTQWYQDPSRWYPTSH